MPTSPAVGRRAASGRVRVRRLLGLAVLLAVAGCSTAETPEAPETPETPDESLAPSAAGLGASPTSTASPTPPPSPSPTPEPTPRFTNEPDPELAALIPATAGGATLVVPPLEEFAITPGDVGGVYGEIGDRFHSLVLAYAEEPRTTLYAMRVDGEPVATEDLEPHLAEAARYVGIAGLHRDPWQTTTVDGHLVWVRPEDNATVAGTHVYTWAAEEFVFLLIGVDDAVNRAIIAALPGEAAPTPSPRSTQSPTPSASP